VTETIESSAAKKRGGGLNSLLLADLKAMAGGMGITGSGSMKKAQLVEAIKAARAGAPTGRQNGAQGSERQQAPAPRQDRAERQERQERPEPSERPERPERPEQQPPTSGPEPTGESPEKPGQDQGERNGQRRERHRDRHQAQPAQEKVQEKGQEKAYEKVQDAKSAQDKSSQDKPDQQGGQDQGQRADEEGGSRRNRRRRGRDRDRERTPAPRQGGGSAGASMRNEPDTQVLEDDVLVPAAGILDVLDNYAFVRTSGYLPGSDDVYLSLSMVRKFGMRRGDAIVGQVRQPREGERKEKFNPMVRVDSVNGADPETARHRVEFAKLTPLYPSERLRLETGADNLIGRVIDIAAPIGKGQRGLIVSPSKAGKTMIMQSIANSITTNNPECHLMVVLVDERPEEVTDFERSVKGEVISSTFDRPAADHTIVAELAIERAKRLVELGHDVVVLLDGITRLGRAYNLAAPASGRILSGGVDSAALYPPKKFFGAARNIENGGSLTILATALIESGSKMDEVIFEEFKGTGNMELRLRRDFADKRLFPAIDAVQSGTRREELLMSKEELAIVWKLRRVMSGLDGQQALELLLERLKKSHSNIEFLMQVQKTTPSPHGDE
jgi:transcription termination factor Rho